MTFSAITDPDTLSTFVEFATAVTEEAVLHLGTDELALTARDPANVALVDLTLDADVFEAYDADGGRIGLDLARLADVLKIADSGELVHLDLDESTRTLTVKIGTLEYTVGLIDPETVRSDTEVPNILDNLTAHVAIEAGRIQDAHRAADLCAKNIEFGADPDAGTFYADVDGDTDHVRVEWGRDETEDGTRIDSAAESMFSLAYQKDAFKPIAANQVVTVHLGDEFPMVVDSEFADGDGDARFSIAPRVET